MFKGNLIAVILAVLPVGALANDGFGGSFGGGFNTTPQPVNPPGGNSGFGGSFDSGGGFGQPETGQQTQPPQNDVPVVGGNDFAPGAFDNQQGGQPPVLSDGPPQNSGQPPQNQFQPPQNQDQPPQNQVRPGPQIDPRIASFESRDFGVPPTNQLHRGPMHGPTPSSVPGARTIGTADLAGAMQSGQQLLLIDVLGGNYALPGALTARDMATPGSYNDRTQQQVVQWLGQITRGQRQTPIVIYCSDPNCWLSYNATLRAVAAGYQNVFWYRGGLQAWQMAGLQLMPAGF
ncbi:MAG: rhodanese-like domain-containing protein [Sedimentitalea sp.]